MELTNGAMIYSFLSDFRYRSILSFLAFFCAVNLAFAFTIDPGSPQTACEGKKITLGGSPTASGGKAPYKYQWTSSVGGVSASVANPEVTVPDPGAGNTIVTFTLEVEDAGGFKCEATVDITVIRVSDVKATDPSPQPDASGPARVATNGQTLVIIDHNDAMIEAVPEGGSFPAGCPTWSGTNAPADGTTSFTSSSILDGTYTAGTKTVNVNTKQKITNSIGYPGFTASNINREFNNKFKFQDPGTSSPSSLGSLSFTLSLGATTFNTETVERYGHPDFGWKRAITLGISASVMGKIKHPTFSGNVSVPLVGSVSWGLFATAGVTGSITGGVEKDPAAANPPTWQGQNLTASLTGTIGAGFEFDANTNFIKVGGSITASTGLVGSLRLNGSNIEAKGDWTGLVGNVTLFCYFSDPASPFVNYTGTYNLIDGASTGWAVIYSLPTD